MKKKLIPSAIPIEGVSDSATERERFEALTRQVLSVPKTEIDRREGEWKREKALKKKAKASSESEP